MAASRPTRWHCPDTRAIPVTTRVSARFQLSLRRHRVGEPFTALETLTRCCACDSRAIALRWRHDLWQCGDCGLVFRNPRPVQRDVIASYDAGLTFAAWQAEAAARAPLWQRRLALLRRHCAGGRLLDVGTGDGAFLDVARVHYAVEATEVSAAGARLARERGHAPKVGPLEAIDLPPQRYDAITLWHVLEHLPHPAAALRRLAASLAPGGVLIVAVPNELGPLLRQRLTPGRIDPLGRLGWGEEVHLCHFTPRSLRRLLGACGLRVLATGVDDVHLRRPLRTRLGLQLNRALHALCGGSFDRAMFAVCRRA